MEKNLILKVLGTGCKKCNDLESNVKAALKELELDADLIHVTDFTEIAKMGVMRTPALSINNKLVSVGKVLDKDSLIKTIKNFV